ncbi:uncharacterized protein LOC101857714 [Aplysia californica]|uniref:Uncharacterized protein LOC101857714 n=1 Tax=Aplysia californica TaxID=6500 RepID=A0ABM1VRU2_APLCA|nr:uncharacterized protein LOC101857714 [Aplysia californica]XP_035825134.1 uncharacterized protein LOC101857714 [Aplysia californica]
MEVNMSITEARSGQNQSLHAVNPWEHDNWLMTALRNSLIVAEQMGFETLGNESQCAKALADLPSVRLIGQQKEITSKKKAIHKAKHTIAQHTLEKETASFTHLDVIEKRINLVKELCSDFDSVIKNASVLTHRLQKPFVGDHIKFKMDAAYHKYAKEVFSLLVPTLNDVSSHLDNITWASHSDLSASQLDFLLVEMKSLTASVQTSFITLCQMRSGVESLCSGTSLSSLAGGDNSSHLDGSMVQQRQER